MIIGPIRQELLSGISDISQFNKLKDKKLIPDENGVPLVLKLPIKELEETIYAVSTQSGTLSVHAKLFHDLKPLKSLPIANALKQSTKQ